jgi:hypothetical protein
MENLTRRGYWIRRRCIYHPNTDPPHQWVVEVMHGDTCLAEMASESMLSLAEGFVPIVQASDDQVLRGYLHQSLF